MCSSLRTLNRASIRIRTHEIRPDPPGMSQSAHGRTGLVAMVLLLVMVMAALVVQVIRSTQDHAEPPEHPGMQNWHCHNTLEVRCARTGCTVLGEDDFTPMSVNASSSGELSVCAYSGCWQGQARAWSRSPWLFWTAHQLPWQGMPAQPEAAEDVVLVIDQDEGIALIRAGPFAQALICDSDR